MPGSIFLTGAGGFLGSHVLKRLSEDRNRNVICLIRGKMPDSAPPNVRYISGDLLRPQGYADALSGCDTVLHMAAATGKHSPEEYMRVNRDGTAALIQQSRQSGVSRFIFVSSVAAKFRDQFRYYYAQSKQEAEAIVAASGLRWTIIRPAMILGKNSAVLDNLAKLSALPVLPIFGDGRVPVQPVFVDDLAECLIALVESKEDLQAATVEIGGPEVLSIEDLLQRIRSTSGKSAAPVLHLPVNAIARLIGWMEPFLLPLLPFTAGQLASFSNPGTTVPHSWVARRQKQMTPVSEMLRSAVSY
jgi:NADH dehydrogenase